MVLLEIKFQTKNITYFYVSVESNNFLNNDDPVNSGQKYQGKFQGLRTNHLDE